MKVFLKSNRSFRTTQQRTVLTYDLCLDSLETEAASLTVAGDDLPGSVTRQFLILNGAVYLAGTVTPGNGDTKIAVLPADEIFNRALLYDETETPPATVGAFLARQITAQWINQPDSAYAMPFLTVANHDATPFAPPERDDSGLYSFLDYLRAMRSRYGVTLHFTARWNTLSIEIRTDTPGRHTLIHGDGHTKVESAAFASSGVAKVTTVQTVNDIRQAVNWYLATDGTISSSVPQNRAEGIWEMLPISENDDAAQKAAELFAKTTSAAHKIELHTDVPMAVGDSFRLRYNGEVFTGHVSAVRQKFGERWPLYRSGDLATTLPEKVRSLRKE